jgi:glycoside/pentoside/hexuronide:cation symporter, GPH family
VQDPIIGLLSDRYSHKMGLSLGFFSVLLVVGIYALFHPHTEYPLLWFCVCVAFTVTAYSILSIQLNTLGALWSACPNQQTRISTARETFGLAGLVLALTLPYLLESLFTKSQVYSVYSLILAGLMLITLGLCLHWQRTRPIKSLHRTMEFKNLVGAIQHLPKITQTFYGVYAISVLASSLPALLIVFFVRDLLNAASYLGLFLLIYFAAAALAMSLWQTLSQRLGSLNAWGLSMLLAVVSFIGAFLLNAHDVIPFIIICAASGMAFGADLALPPAILSQQIHQQNTQNTAATQYAFLALLNKAGLAFGSALALPFLDWVGFIPAAQNSNSALGWLSVLYALVPCALKLLSALLLYRLLIAHKMQ